MSRLFNRPNWMLAAAVAVTAGTLVMQADPSIAASKRQLRRRLASVVRAEAPLGVRRGNDAVILPFTLAAGKGRRSIVQVEYGYDRNGDGLVSTGDGDLASEYMPCTHNRKDPRDTASSDRPLRFKIGVPPGISHAFSWNSVADLSGQYIDALGQFVTTDEGRQVIDPNFPEDFLRTNGQHGVRIRYRTLKGGRRSGVRSDWVYTASFTVNNNALPTLALQAVDIGDTVGIFWTGTDADSEDTNGDGVLDILGGEDRDGDGELDGADMSVAFDYHFQEGDEDLSNLTPEELAGLRWLPCTIDSTDGAGNLNLPTTPNGRTHSTAWDWQSDPTLEGAPIILRSRGFDGQEHTQYIYWTAPFTLPSLDT